MTELCLLSSFYSLSNTYCLLFSMNKPMQENTIDRGCAVVLGRKGMEYYQGRIDLSRGIRLS